VPAAFPKELSASVARVRPLAYSTIVPA